MLKRKKATNSTAYKAMTAFLMPLNCQNGDYYTGRLLDSKTADIGRMATFKMGTVGFNAYWEN